MFFFKKMYFYFGHITFSFVSETMGKYVSELSKSIERFRKWSLKGPSFYSSFF